MFKNLTSPLDEMQQLNIYYMLLYSFVGGGVDALHG